MAPKGGNAKKESGRAKKAENEAKKKDAAAADKVCPRASATIVFKSSSDYDFLIHTPHS
jgi:hypothetical protein